MKIHLRLASLLPFFLLLTGCCEFTEEYTINPDGSGKVILETAFQEVDINDGFVFSVTVNKVKKEKLTPEMDLKKSVSKVLNTKGVDVWKDVEAKYLSDGRMWFKGTAYFKDLSKLELSETATKFIKMKISKNPDGLLILEKRMNPEKDKSQEKSSEVMTEEKVLERITEFKICYQKTRPFIMGAMCSFRFQSSFRLPGTIQKNENMNYDSKEGVVKIFFDGQKAFEELDAMSRDDKWIRKKIDELDMNIEKDMIDFEKLPMISGLKSPIAVCSPPFKNLFDYNVEVFHAKLEYPQLLEKWKPPEGAQSPEKGK